MPMIPDAIEHAAPMRKRCRPRRVDRRSAVGDGGGRRPMTTRPDRADDRRIPMVVLAADEGVAPS
jgi:hypothetical protein